MAKRKGLRPRQIFDIATTVAGMVGLLMIYSWWQQTLTAQNTPKKRIVRIEGSYDVHAQGTVTWPGGEQAFHDKMPFQFPVTARSGDHLMVRAKNPDGAGTLRVLIQRDGKTVASGETTQRFGSVGVLEP